MYLTERTSIMLSGLEESPAIELVASVRMGPLFVLPGANPSIYSAASNYENQEDQKL